MNPIDKDTIIFQQILSYDSNLNKVITVDYRIVPASMSSRKDINNFQPIIVSEKEGERILEKYKELSDKIK